MAQVMVGPAMAANPASPPEPEAAATARMQIARRQAPQSGARDDTSDTRL